MNPLRQTSRTTLGCAGLLLNFSKMAEKKIRALGYWGRSFALKGSYSDATKIWDAMLSLTKTSIQRAYLYHEIGRCNYGTLQEILTFWRRCE